MRAPRRMRHRLQGERAEHARPQLHSARRTAPGRRPRRCTSCGPSSRTATATGCTSTAIADGALHRGSIRGRIVIVAAGSLGSTELLLQCRDLHRTLPNLSAVPRPELEQQRRLPDAGAAPAPQGEPDARPDDHVGDRSARRHGRRPGDLHRRRRPARSRDRLSCAISRTTRAPICG